MIYNFGMAEYEIIKFKRKNLEPDEKSNVCFLHIAHSDKLVQIYNLEAIERNLNNGQKWIWEKSKKDTFKK